MSGTLCNIYRSSKKEGMYLYVDKRDDLEKIPEDLMDFFGKPLFSMSLLITKDKKLARADALKVLQEIAEKGFYMQMPPSIIDTHGTGMADLAKKNTMLSR